ncbi:hypothetical protein [Nocardia nepalensis]|uniref:hypothetical protein n=1 Tax=Nocardia nepalensis TaxID=3375448 RepID=UPI003B685DBD
MVVAKSFIVDAEWAMMSWREELDRREAAAAERVEQLRRQIAELTKQRNSTACRDWRSHGKR